MDDRSKFVRDKVAAVVIGRDEETGSSVVFIVEEQGALAISFPAQLGVVKELTASDVDLFLIVTPDSEMRSAIEKVWRGRATRTTEPERRPQ